jgi:lipoic acid synthetase
MIEAGQEVVSHNIETVPRLYPTVCPQAKYARSLEQLKRIKDYGKKSKSGMMLGRGETAEEVYQAMDDLVAHGLDILTLGQYLQPTKAHLAVQAYIHLNQFEHFKLEGLKRGLKYVEAGPLVRSSYHAERHVYV